MTNFYLGMSIFKSYSRPNENNKDPFHKNSDGAPPKSSAKLRKPSRILKTIINQGEHHDVFPSEQKRNTKRIRKNIRNAKVIFKLIYNLYIYIIFLN